MKNQFRIQYDVESYTAIRTWKRELAKNSHFGTLSDSTWKNSLYWIEKLIKSSSSLSPDELIEEAMNDPEKGQDRLYSCFEWTKRQNLDHNSIVIGVYGTLRGFYKHNHIDTRNWHTPKQLPRKVEQTDGNYPLFRPNKITKKLELNLSLIRNFLRKLNSRDEVIAICLLTTGMDIGDLVKLDMGFVNRQSQQERLYVSNFRSKNGEWIKTFFSKEATALLRKYAKEERFNAKDSEPIFVTSRSERKKQFKIINHRPFRANSVDELPAGRQVDTRVVATNFRVAQESLGINLEKGKQAPIRPKRFRHIFRQACSLAGFGDDLTRVFMGQKSSSSKSYQPKSREELEVLYQSVEPFLSVYSDPVASDLEQKLQQEKKDNQIKFEKYDKEMEDLKFKNKVFLTLLYKLQKQNPNLSVTVKDSDQLFDWAEEND